MPLPEDGQIRLSAAVEIFVCVTDAGVAKGGNTMNASPRLPYLGGPPRELKIDVHI